jgi:hypothetical protein
LIRLVSGPISAVSKRDKFSITPESLIVFLSLKTPFWGLFTVLWLKSKVPKSDCYCNGSTAENTPQFEDKVESIDAAARGRPWHNCDDVHYF